MTDISYGAELHVPIEEAFDYVSDPQRWSTFIHSIRSAQKSADWGTLGGHARTVTRILGRTVTSEMVVTEWEPPYRFRYTAHQRGAPDLDNLRVFEPLADGTRLTGTTTAVLRGGLTGLVDRVRWVALERLYHRAMRRLPEVIPHRSVGPAARI